MMREFIYIVSEIYLFLYLVQFAGPHRVEAPAGASPGGRPRRKSFFFSPMQTDAYSPGVLNTVFNSIRLAKTWLKFQK